MKRKNTPLIKQYRSKCALFDGFLRITDNLLNELFAQNSIRPFSVTHRLKDEASLLNKINRPDGRHTKLDEITDICGLRIITYFADEVDSIASIVSNEFDVDWENSIDKRIILDPDRFGYLSLHYIVKLSESRLKLTEYNRFSQCKAEIQIRSILQHAWAEIQHDLGYKTRETVPRPIQRRFSQLAGILELADDDFIRLRDQLTNYTTSLPDKISGNPSSVNIDIKSLYSYVIDNPLSRQLIREIESAKNLEFHHAVTPETIARLYFLGFETIADIDSSLKELYPVVLHIAKELIVSGEELEEDSYDIDTPIFYLCYAKIASEDSPKRLIEFVNHFFGDSSLSGRQTMKKHILRWYSEGKQLKK